MPDIGEAAVSMPACPEVRAVERAGHDSKSAITDAVCEAGRPQLRMSLSRALLALLQLTSIGVVDGDAPAF